MSFENYVIFVEYKIGKWFVDVEVIFGGLEVFMFDFFEYIMMSW